MQVLESLPSSSHPDLIEGHSSFSDAGVYRLREDLAIVQTVDFFPPMVDDPRTFGRVAAANALSDCYATAARPVTALNIAGFPNKELPLEVLGEILAGGAEKVAEAGAVIVGGHTVEDREVKFGLAVTGTVDPARWISNSGAREGDALVLTKPLGTGCVSTAIKKRKIGTEDTREAIASMSTLNRDASSAMIEFGAHAATDVTGFGFLGHALHLARASRVSLEFSAEHIPLLPGVRELALRGLVSGGEIRNRRSLEGDVSWSCSVSPWLDAVLFDAETSGGLLISIPANRSEDLVRRLRELGHVFTTTVGVVQRLGEVPLEIS